jgi:hypothetical protein
MFSDASTLSRPPAPAAPTSLEDALSSDDDGTTQQRRSERSSSSHEKDDGDNAAALASNGKHTQHTVFALGLYV